MGDALDDPELNPAKNALAEPTCGRGGEYRAFRNRCVYMPLPPRGRNGESRGLLGSN